MQFTVKKRKVRGVVSIPSSKSITHRALVCAALAGGKSTIFNPLMCDDTQATLEGLKAIGTGIQKLSDRWIVHGGDFQRPKKAIDCRESGTTLRFLTAITHQLNLPCKLSGALSLLKRPMAPLERALKNLGGFCEVEGNVSSQFLSALLLAAPLARQKTTLILADPPVSKPYLLLTLDVQEAFGIFIRKEENFSKFEIARQEYLPANFTVEGDWSSAAPFLAGGACAGEVRIKGLNRDSLQGDRGLIAILKEMGGNVDWEGEDLLSKKAKLRPIRWDLSSLPDLFPIVSVLCATAQGRSILRGVGRLQYKESNRPEAILQIFRGAGIRSGLEGDDFWIEGGRPKGVSIDSKDHRILMAGAVLGLVTEGETTLENAEHLKKSFPEFLNRWEALQ